MKICVECGHEFKPKGRQKICGECKNEGEKLQKTNEAEVPEQKAVRPLDRWRTNVVMPGQLGVKLRRGT